MLTGARRFIAMCLAFVLIVAACGGDDDDATANDGDSTVTEADADAGSTDEAEATATEPPITGGEAGSSGSVGDGGDSEEAEGADGADDTDGGDDPEAEAGDGAEEPTPTPLTCTEDGAQTVAGEFPTPGVGDRLLVDARMGTQPGFDRFVLEFSGDVGNPPNSYVAQWSSVPVSAEGSGAAIVVEGDWFLEIRVAGATMFDFDTGVPYDGPTTVSGATTNVRAAASGGSFEGYMVWAIGADQPTGYRIQELSDPSRLVVDVCTDGPTFEDEAVSGPVPCPLGEVPPGVTQFASFVGGEDLDGDGAEDTIYAFVDPAINRWVLAVEPGGGGVVLLPTELGSAIAPGDILGSIDLDGDGHREIFGVFDVGARATIINVAQFRDCELSWVRFEGGEVAGFVVTGGIFDAAAVSCIFPEGWISQDSAINLATDPDTGEPISWTLESTVYRLEGGVLIDVNAGAPPNPDPPFIESTVPPLEPTLNCDGLSL